MPPSTFEVKYASIGGFHTTTIVRVVRVQTSGPWIIFYGLDDIPAAIFSANTLMSARLIDNP